MCHHQMLFQVLIPLVVLVAPILFILHRLLEYFIDPHKLRRFPSLDIFAPLTNFSYIRFVSTHSFRTRSLHSLHQNHPVIRLGPNSVSFASPEAIKDIYGHSAKCVKGDMYSTAAGAHRSLLDCVDKNQHAEKRRRLAAAFAAKNLEGWEWKVRDKVERLLAQFDVRSEGGGVLDWRAWSNLFTVEAIADIALSQRLGLLERGDDAVLAENEEGTKIFVAFKESLHGLGRAIEPIVWSGTAYPVLKKLTWFIPAWRREWTRNSNFSGICSSLIRDRLAQYRRGEELDDFFGCLMEDKAGEALDLDLGEVAAEVEVFMNAGSDTTAIALTHVLYFLLKNPEKLKKLRAELHHHIDNDTIIPEYSTVRQCTYLRACLDESLRLFPPVSFGLERKTPPGGIPVAGHWIAGNVHVSVPAYTTHRDPTVFPNPECFVPERWLEDEMKQKQKYFLAFSAGARGCIGKNITYLEQSVLIASVVRRYNFELLDKEWEMDWEERFNLWPISMPVRVGRRLHS